MTFAHATDIGWLPPPDTTTIYHAISRHNMIIWDNKDWIAESPLPRLFMKIIKYYPKIIYTLEECLESLPYHYVSKTCQNKIL